MQKDNKFLVTIIIYLTVTVMLVLLQIMGSLGVFSGLPIEWRAVIGSILPQIILMLILPGTMLLIGQKINHEPVSIKTLANELHYRRLSIKNILLLIAFGFCLYMINVVVRSLFGSLIQSFGYQYTEPTNVFSGYTGLCIELVLSALLPAFCEEFLHRGILLRGSIKQFGVQKAVLLTSFLFAFMHMNIAQFFYTAVIGWFLCLIVLATNSLWAGVIVHFVNNAIATYLSYTTELNLPGLGVFNTIFANPLLYIVVIILAVVLVGEILRYFAKENFEKNLDVYTVRYLSAQNQFGPGDFDKIKIALPKAIQTMSTWKATFAYIETFDQGKPLKPLARSLLITVIILGVIITGLSFAWGTW